VTECKAETGQKQGPAAENEGEEHAPGVEGAARQEARPNGEDHDWREPPMQEPPDPFDDPADDEMLRRQADAAADAEFDAFTQFLEDDLGVGRPTKGGSDKGAPTKEKLSEVLRRLHELNRRFFLARQGASVYVFEQCDRGEPPEPMTITAFGALHANEALTWEGPQGGHHRINLSKLWTTWIDRKQYRRIVFDPGGRSDPADDFNLWEGLAISPSKQGSCERFKHHLLHHICGGNEEYYRYLWRWSAHAVQYPERMPKVAVVLIGDPGGGKTTYGEVMGTFFGPHFKELDRPDDLTGRFNYPLRNKVLFLANELGWRGSKVAENKLKTLITDPTRTHEPKGIDAITDPNFAKVIITSNEEHVVPVRPGDRRFFALKVVHTFADDVPRRLAYFKELRAELDNGGYERLLWELFNEPLDDFNPEDRPDTEALAEQKAHSMEPHEAWWLGLLERGELPSEFYPDEWGMVQGCELHRDYLDHCHATRVRFADRFSERALLIRLKTLLPEPPWSLENPYVNMERKGRTSRKRVRHLKPAPLEACRARWDERMRTGHEWSG
jgi:hypothetical protein